MKKLIAIIIAIMFLAFLPYLPKVKSEEQKIFTNVATENGLNITNGNFLAWGDYDNDGDDDLLVDGKMLFRNDFPENKFTDITSIAKISSNANTGNFGDYDNDGDLDIYCPSGGRDENGNWDGRWDILFRNNGDGTFTNVTEIAGNVYDTYPSVASAFGDIDNDGDLDLYVANYENSDMSEYYPDTLWLNNGDGTFTDITKSAGIDDYTEPKPGRGVSFADYDNDNDLDIYISNYRLKPNYLWENNGEGKFRDVAEEKGVAGNEKYQSGIGLPGETAYYGHSLGAIWGDIDNDNDLDLWVINLAHKDIYRGPLCDDSQLLRNNGYPNYDFTDIRSSSGIPTKPLGGAFQEGDELFVGSAFGDYDNDGFLDLYISQIYDNIDYAYSYLYRNNGDNTFTDVTEKAGVRVWDTYAGAWADFNKDGYLDLITGGKNESTAGKRHELRLFKNNGNSGNWIQVDLIGKENKFGIGIRVMVYDGENLQIREVEGGMGCHSHQNSLTLHFGLGSSSQNIQVGVYWEKWSITSWIIEDVNKRIAFFEGKTSLTIITNNTTETPRINLTKLFNVFGVVKDDKGNLLEGVEINIDNRSTTTDKDGKFKIENITKGVYSIDAKKDGYEPFSKVINVENDTEINITLKEIKKENPRWFIPSFEVFFVLISIILVLFISRKRNKNLLSCSSCIINAKTNYQ